MRLKTHTQSTVRLKTTDDNCHISSQEASRVTTKRSMFFPGSFQRRCLCKWDQSTKPITEGNKNNSEMGVSVSQNDQIRSTSESVNDGAPSMQLRQQAQVNFDVDVTCSTRLGRASGRYHLVSVLGSYSPRWVNSQSSRRQGTEKNSSLSLLREIGAVCSTVSPPGILGLGAPFAKDQARWNVCPCTGRVCASHQTPAVASNTELSDPETPNRTINHTSPREKKSPSWLQTPPF